MEVKVITHFNVTEEGRGSINLHIGVASFMDDPFKLVWIEKHKFTRAYMSFMDGPLWAFTASLLTKIEFSVVVTAVFTFTSA